MTTSLATQQDKQQVARPLAVLVPLIRDDLQHGDDAAKQASMPYYIAAGEKMIEAKAQAKHGEFTAWIKRNFKIGERQAREYMNLARATVDMQNGSALPFSTIREAVRETRDNPNYGKTAPWLDSARETLGNVDLETLNLRRAELNRAEERAAEKKLATQLIDIGFRALASKLHPDKGGSRDAMARLNKVRDRLRSHA